MKLPSIIALIATLSGCAAVPPRPTNITGGDYTSTKAYLTKLIRYEMDKNRVTGLSIALVDDQRLIWAEGFGYADQERKLPATAETLYRVGSISKLFTDTAAMQLAEQGRFDIDQPLRTYLSDFSIKTRYPDAAEITPRQLMTHHSGLPRDWLKGFFTTATPGHFTELKKDIRHDYVAYPPNTVLSYSNLGITLLGDAIQQQSGQPFAQYMQKSVLTPLGMNNSSFDTGPATSLLMAKGYRGREAAIEPALRDLPAGGLNSSVTDLSHFISMVFAGGISGNQRILKTETVAEMLRPQNSAVPLDFNFRIGLGWMLSTLDSSIKNAGTVAHHSGATPFFRSQMYLLPEHKLGVVVLSNSSTAMQAVDHIATQALTLALEAKSGIQQPQRSRIPPDDKPLAMETVQEYSGDYTTVAGLARIRACGRDLCADAANHSFDLVRGSDGLFRLEYSLFGIIPLDLGALGDIGFSRRTVAGRDLLVAHAGEQEMLAGQRIDPPSNLSAWRRYLGDYEIINLESDHKTVERIRLLEERGLLLIELTPTESPGEKARIPLMPVSENEGRLLGPLNDGGETVRIVAVEGEERVLFSGYLLKKVAQ